LDLNPASLPTIKERSPMADYPQPYDQEAALSDPNPVIVEARKAALAAMVKMPLSSRSKVGYVSVKSTLGTERITNLVDTYEIPILRAGAEAFCRVLARHGIHGTIEQVLD
jgi:hypothetical protein